LKIKDLRDIGGACLIELYNNSPSQLLSKVFPDYNWLPWRFGTCPRNFWDDAKNQRNFMDWAATQLNIKEMSDWYKITAKVTYHKLNILKN
jgi:hypothetical protein